MTKTILPGQTIGIIGGGNTARLLILEAKRLGYLTAVLTNDKNDPAAKVADWVIEGSATDSNRLMDLAQKSAVLIFESALMEMEVLESIQSYIEIPQLSDMLSVTQDRLIEKVFLESLNVNVMPYAIITSLEDLKEAVGSIGFPCVLKPIRVEEDQIPNAILYSDEDFSKAKKMLETGTLLVESWVSFDKELSITSAIDSEGEITTFPIVEKVVSDGILQKAAAPARIVEEVSHALHSMNQVIMEAIQLIGLVTIELFITSLGMIYVKRIAVNPQESNDYTLDACNISQYEAFIRAICNLPIPEIELFKPVAVHYIYPGEVETVLDNIILHPEWKLHLDSQQIKSENKSVGHITLFSPNLEEFDRKGKWK
ncbi:MAG TPA: ATP-grasp domain-containing protein [Candidatus Jeotgalibaca pullicola]|nr:ATP-grasp domain-containing protein [Candidatus Jeotgalibaca pullicola]